MSVSTIPSSVQRQIAERLKERRALLEKLEDDHRAIKDGIGTLKKAAQERAVRFAKVILCPEGLLVASIHKRTLFSNIAIAMSLSFLSPEDLANAKAACKEWLYLAGNEKLQEAVWASHIKEKAPQFYFKFVSIDTKVMILRYQHESNIKKIEARLDKTDRQLDCMNRVMRVQSAFCFLALYSIGLTRQ
jgi:hypothetical protein